MLSKSTTPEIVREVPDNLPECYAKLASAPTPPHLKRRRHPSDRELAYLTRQGAQDEPEPAAAEPKLKRKPPKRFRRRWQKGRMWQSQFAKWLADADRADTVEGCNAVLEERPSRSRSSTSLGWRRTTRPSRRARPGRRRDPGRGRAGVGRGRRARRSPQRRVT